MNIKYGDDKTSHSHWPCGNLSQCNRCYRIGARIREPRRPLDSAPPSGKCIKMRPLSTVATIYDQSLLHLPDNSKATCPAIAGRQEARLLAQRAPNLHEPCRPVQISAVPNPHLPQRTGNQRRSARPATHSLPAESSLLTSERPGKNHIGDPDAERETILVTSETAWTPQNSSSR
jgi:hypothetical protein